MEEQQEKLYKRQYQCEYCGNMVENGGKICEECLSKLQEE